MSTKKTGQRSKHKIDAASHGLGKFAVGAKLLPKADKDEGLNEPV